MRAHCDEKKTWDLYAVCEVLMDKMDVVFLSQSLDLDNLGRRDVFLEQVMFDFFISPHLPPFCENTTFRLGCPSRMHSQVYHKQ